MIRRDNEEGTYGGRVQTRFPPEPNGYPHIGQGEGDRHRLRHRRGLRRPLQAAPRRHQPRHRGRPNTSTRSSTTSPGSATCPPRSATPRTTSGSSTTGPSTWCRPAWPTSTTPTPTISAQRGIAFPTPGVESPYRNRTPEENLDLLRRMRSGEFPDGAKVLRAKIDMTHENMQMRDPVKVSHPPRRPPPHRRRLGHLPHLRLGPRPVRRHRGRHAFAVLARVREPSALYDWFLAHLPLESESSQQREFARPELTHTITSKRRLRKLVTDGIVDGWDDPRMPTLRGLRRRGYLDGRAARVLRGGRHHPHQLAQGDRGIRVVRPPRAQPHGPAPQAVLRPLKLVITNWPTDADGAPVVEHFEVANNPENPRRRPSGGVQR